MTTAAELFDTLIVGGGIAGLAAAQTLQRHGQRVLILEASQRLGGRVYTRHDLTDHPVEFGAELIHGDHVPTWGLVKRLGLATRQWTKQEDALVRLEPPHPTTSLMNMAQARAQYPDFDLTRSWDSPIFKEQPPLDHESFETYLARIGFSEAQLRYVWRSFGNACGESPDKLSAQEIVLELLIDQEGQENDYRILEGYDCIIQALAQDIAVVYDAVTHVAYAEGGHHPVTLTTATRAQYHAQQVIISVPLSVLQKQHISFAPALSDEKLRALEGLQMAPALKMVLVFDEPLCSPDISSFYSAHNPPMWWSPSWQRGSNKQVWTAFVTGDWARHWLQMSPEKALAEAATCLTQELAPKRSIIPAQAHIMNWQAEPSILGGYSSVKPGHTGARAKLARPTPPLYWAGEATAPAGDCATVHGALVSGVRSALEILSEAPQAPHDTYQTTYNL